MIYPLPATPCTDVFINQRYLLNLLVLAYFLDANFHRRQQCMVTARHRMMGRRRKVRLFSDRNPSRVVILRLALSFVWSGANDKLPCAVVDGLRLFTDLQVKRCVEIGVFQFSTACPSLLWLIYQLLSRFTMRPPVWYSPILSLYIVLQFFFVRFCH